MSLVRWSIPARTLIFLLSATSIWCLLAEFYGLCSMRLFTFAILIPASLALIAIAALDRVIGEREVWRAVAIGATAGFIAACAYDLFRLPFVIAAADKIGPEWLRLPLFKVFPRFGALILGEPFAPNQIDSQFSLSAHLVGWVYHFSNGITFGVMYMALVGDATKRSWMWGIAFAAGLELAMLLSPYPSYFAIPVTIRFLFVTLSAHTLFGIVMGIASRKFSASSPQVAIS